VHDYPVKDRGWSRRRRLHGSFWSLLWCPQEYLLFLHGTLLLGLQESRRAGLLPPHQTGLEGDEGGGLQEHGEDQGTNSVLEFWPACPTERAVILLLVDLEEVPLVSIVEEVVPQRTPAKEGESARATWDGATNARAILAEESIQVVPDLLLFPVPLFGHECEKCLHANSVASTGLRIHLIVTKDDERA
jgi:hypothetical protein